MKTVHINRTNLGEVDGLLDIAARESLWWDLDESLTEGELIQLAQATYERPGASSLLQVIATHPLVGAVGLRDLAELALQTEDIGVLNAIVTLQKTPTDVLRRLQRHPSPSVRGHVKENLDHRKHK